jgi:hypothetical protein
MSQNPPHTTLEATIKDLQQNIALLEYQLNNMPPFEPDTFSRLYQLYLLNSSIPDSLTFYCCCKKLMHRYTTEQQLHQCKEELSNLYTEYINTTLPILSTYLTKIESKE